MGAFGFFHLVCSSFINNSFRFFYIRSKKFISFVLKKSVIFHLFCSFSVQKIFRLVVKSFVQQISSFNKIFCSKVCSKNVICSQKRSPSLIVKYLFNFESQGRNPQPQDFRQLNILSFIQTHFN